jgi:intracellular multiplication protein IcmL
MKYFAHIMFLSALTAQTALAENTPNPISCHFPLTAPVLNTRPLVVTEWANYVVTKAFTYDYKNYKEQFSKAKACFTSSGWAGFAKAFEDAKNLQTLEKEQLYVSAKVNGKTTLVAQFKDTTVEPFWLVRVPITVTYHNNKKQMSQNMTVDLNIKTTSSGTNEYFGINQLIAKSKTIAHSS